MKSSDGAKAGYKLEGQVADWSPSLISADVSPEVDVSGNPSLTPAGRSTNLSFGIIEDNAMALVETRVRASLELDASVAANAYFSNYLSSSKDKSRQKLLYSEQSLGDGRIPTKVMLSADHALSGFEASLGSGGSETLFASRQLSSFAGAIGSDNVHPSDFLPGRGGLISGSGGSIEVQAFNQEGAPTFDFSISSVCDWPNAIETYFMGGSGITELNVVAVLQQSPLHVGLASVTQTAAANWQRDCKFVPYENDMDPEVPSFLKASPNGKFIALGFGTENSYSLKVWSSMGLEDIAVFTLPRTSRYSIQ